MMTLLPLLASGPVDLDTLWEKLGRKFPLPANASPSFKTALLDSLLALIATARRLPSSAPASSEQADNTGPVLPWVNLRVQFWLRELRRMVATVEAQPRLLFADDRTAEDNIKVLPVLNCRECGSTGWGGLRQQTGDRQIGCNLKDFYIAYFGHNPLTTFIFPTDKKLSNPEPGWHLWQFCTQCLSLNRDTALTCNACGHDELLPVLEPDMLREVKTPQGNVRRESHHDCPFCDAKNSLSIMGSRAASLSSVVIGTLFGSVYNGDRKLITFSDSVQDAAHRAGFFGARTFSNTLRTALAQYLDRQERGPIPRSSGFWFSAILAAATRVRDGLCGHLHAHRYAVVRGMETLLQTDKVSPTLLSFIDQRLHWEIIADTGLRSTIGRSLEQVGVCSVQINPEQLQSTVKTLLPELRNEVGALRDLDSETLTRFLLGLLRHLRQRGGILHPEAIRYIEQNGKSFILQQRIFMPGFGPASRLPIYLSDKSGIFEKILTKDRHTWCYQWAFKSFFNWSELTLIAEQFELIYERVLTALVNQKILELHYTNNSHRVWGLSARHYA